MGNGLDPMINHLVKMAQATQQAQGQGYTLSPQQQNSYMQGTAPTAGYYPSGDASMQTQPQGVYVQGGLGGLANTVLSMQGMQGAGSSNVAEVLGVRR